MLILVKIEILLKITKFLDKIVKKFNAHEDAVSGIEFHNNNDF